MPGAGTRRIGGHGPREASWGPATATSTARRGESQDGYLRFATEQLTPTSPTSVLAHLTRADRDHRFRLDASAIGPDDFAAVFAKIDSFQDTSDFDMMQLVAIWYGHRREITPELGPRSSSAYWASATGSPTRCPRA